jgi:hypothetical protein
MTMELRPMDRLFRTAASYDAVASQFTDVAAGTTGEAQAFFERFCDTLAVVSDLDCGPT